MASRPQKITIQSRTETQDAYGQPIMSYSNYATVWAEIYHLTSREYFDAKQTESENTIKFRLRYDKRMDSLNKQMRVSWDSRTFDIDSVVNVNMRNEYIILVCTEHGA